MSDYEPESFESTDQNIKNINAGIDQAINNMNDSDHQQQNTITNSYIQKFLRNHEFLFGLEQVKKDITDPKSAFRCEYDESMNPILVNEIFTFNHVSDFNTLPTEKKGISDWMKNIFPSRCWLVADKLNSGKKSDNYAFSCRPYLDSLYQPTDTMTLVLERNKGY